MYQTSNTMRDEPSGQLSEVTDLDGATVNKVRRQGLTLFFRSASDVDKAYNHYNIPRGRWWGTIADEWEKMSGQESNPVHGGDGGGQ